MECTFCQIAKGHRVAEIVHKTDRFVVFQPITKASEKLLIVPALHAESLADFPLQELGEWLSIAHHVADIVKARSYRMQINVNNQFQNVRHIYMQFSYQK